MSRAEEQSCWSSWAGDFSAVSNSCHKVTCATARTGHLVTVQVGTGASQCWPVLASAMIVLVSSVQGFKRVRVREAVVLTPECTAANSKPCIFPAALSHATNWADSGYYPACWEKDTDDYRCATEVKYDEVKINLL